MEKPRRILDTAFNIRCHKCLRLIAPWQPKIIIGNDEALEIYHSWCFAILHPEQEGVTK